jgi:hypothetical protein
VSAADRERIAELLEDETRSFRSIGRELGLSDWTIRKIARELDGDPRPMRQRRQRSQEVPTEETSPLIGWLILGGIVFGVAVVIWAGARSAPVQSPDFPTNPYPQSSSERRLNETHYPE